MMRAGTDQRMAEDNLNDSGSRPADPHAGKDSSGTRRVAGPRALADVLRHMGLRDAFTQASTTIFTLAAIGLVIWLTQAFYAEARARPGENNNGPEVPTPVADIEAVMAILPNEGPGIPRQARIHTNVPSRPRQEITLYEVEPGDTVFDIAQRFGLQPETILWSNYDTLLDDPHSLQPGQELFILPVDGVYWQWLGGIPFGEWADFYGVKPEDIISYPGNHIDASQITDFANAEVETGKWLIIPGGSREFVNWSAPLGVTRENPASARVLGPGACDPVLGGSIGYGTYAWPTNKHYLSGFDYSERTNHRGIDLAGNDGEGVYATDAGVVVYSGWNNYGYGNMIMIDHGNGWQSLYAHLSGIYRGCGVSVGQGEGIGAIGSTGRSSGAHLHFELMAGTKVNPWDYLPPP